MDSAEMQAARKLLPAEPAQAHYFLDQGFPDLVATAKEAFAALGRKARERLVRIRRALFAPYGTGFIERAIPFTTGLSSLTAIIVGGFPMMALITLAHATVVAIAAAPSALGVAVMRRVDALHAKRADLSGICPTCKMPFQLPGYRCPSCGAIHYRLRPGRYGVLHHTCTCGQKLPCTWFGSDESDKDGRTFKRDELEAVCTNPAKPHAVEGKETRAVCIPVAGGRSTGKTAFLNAVSYALTEQIAPARGISVSFPPGDSSAFHREVVADYAAGEVSMTVEPTDLSQPTSRALSFRLQSSALVPPRTVHLMDVPGESFVANTEHERQVQYGIADGVVLMIDPMSIPLVGDANRHRLGMIDSAGMGMESPDRVLAALIAKMQDASGTPAGQRLCTPLAIVLGKIDQAGLFRNFDDAAARDLMARDPSVTSSNAHDALCRRFFADNGMGNFLNAVESRFATVRYFACSAIGHVRGTGPYAPRDAMEPISWILAQSDPELHRALGLDGGSSA